MLDLDPAPEEVAYGGVLSVLRSDPALRRVGLTVFDPCDDPEHAPEQMPIPNPEDLPAVRVLAGDYNMAPWTEAFHRGQFALRLEMFVAGHDDRDLWRLFHAVRRALKPTDRPESDAVNVQIDPDRKSVQSARFVRGPARPLAAGQSAYGRRAEASYVMNVQVRTG
jgi:hypothetical protein